MLGLRLLSFVALLGIVAVAGVARAAEDPDTVRAHRHVQAAIAYYDEAKYEDATRELEAAYRLRPVAALQYNLAQCYERLGRTSDAIAAYRKYLDGAPKADDHDSVATRVKNLEERVEREKAGAPPPPAPVEKIVLKEVVVYRETPPPPGRGARIGALLSAVIAAAALATGIGFSVATAQASDTVSKLGATPQTPVPFDGKASEAQATAKTDVVVAGVGYGLAGLAAVAAVGLFLYGHKLDAEAPPLALAPTFAPTGSGVQAGLAVAGRF